MAVRGHGERTVYAASTPHGDYGELLGSLKKPAPMPASDLFDGAGDATIEELIANDWAMAGKRLPPYVVDVHWFYKFRLFTLALPRKGGWWTPRHSRAVTFLEGKVPLTLWEN